MGSRNLGKQQIAAIVQTLQLGKEVAVCYPCVADFYEQGLPCHEIDERLGIARQYGVAPNIAHEIIRHAVYGHNGGFGVEPYGGLIDRERLMAIVKVRRQNHGKNLLQNRKGIFGRTPEERRRDSLKGGQAGGRAGVLARGLIPWTQRQMHGAEGQVGAYCRLAELEYAHNLRVSGQDYESIAATLNHEYHGGKDIRTYNAVKTALREFRKKLQNGAIVSEVFQ